MPSRPWSAHAGPSSLLNGPECGPASLLLARSRCRLVAASCAPLRLLAKLPAAQRTYTDRQVQGAPLGELLAAQGVVAIDWFVLDVEGGEWAVLQAFPFDRVWVGVWTIETDKPVAQGAHQHTAPHLLSLWPAAAGSAPTPFRLRCLGFTCAAMPRLPCLELIAS